MGIWQGALTSVDKAREAGQGDEVVSGRSSVVLVVHRRSTGRRVRAKQAKSERWFLSKLRTRQDDAPCSCLYNQWDWLGPGLQQRIHPPTASPLHDEPTARVAVSTALRRRPNVPSIPFSLLASERHRDGRVRSLGKTEWQRATRETYPNQYKERWSSIAGVNSGVEGGTLIR